MSEGECEMTAQYRLVVVSVAIIALAYLMPDMMRMYEIYRSQKHPKQNVSVTLDNDAPLNGNLGRDRLTLDNDATFNGSLSRDWNGDYMLKTNYSYIAQIIDFADPELENFASFSKLVGKRLNGIAAKEVDISGLVLTGYGIFKKKGDDTDGGSNPEIPTVPVVPITGTGSTDPTPTQLFYLQEVIDRITAAFGDISTRYEQAVFINHLAAILRDDEVVMAQIENNTKETALHGNLPTAVTNAIIQALSSHQTLSAHLLKNDSQAMQNIMLALYKLLKDGETLDVEKLKG